MINENEIDNDFVPNLIDETTNDSKKVPVTILTGYLGNGMKKKFVDNC